MIDYRTEGAIARVILNRPAKRNALNGQMLLGIVDALGRAARDEPVRVIVVSGMGPDFCSGLDLASLDESATAGVLSFMNSANLLAEVYRTMRRHPKPVVAAVHGRALAGGCGIATACDAVLAAESAMFGYPEVKIGFVPGTVMSMLRRSMGEKRAFDLVMSGDPIPAGEALKIGLITRVYPDAQFEARVEAYLAALSEKSASAAALTKRLLYHIDGMGFDEAVETGVQINAIARMTEDAQQGFKKFTKKKE